MLFLNERRLGETFIELCEIDSPSRSERVLARHIAAKFQKLGAARIIEDDSAEETGSDSGNLIIRFPGDGADNNSVFFNCHLDVVRPCQNVRVKYQNGIFTSSGDTVLGGDDKAGIAILLETVQSLKESNITHSPFEIVLTTCEEIGLLGAKAFNTELLKSSYGYSLDSTGSDNVIIGAPASHGIEIDVYGRAAHAGLDPENGINAIQIAGRLLSRLPVGRLDSDSTANIGLIKGGKATNIVPDFVNIQGEIRSHSRQTLDQYLQTYGDTLHEVIGKESHGGENGLPSYSFRSPELYPLMNLAENQPVIQRIIRSAESLGRQLDLFRTGGGSDANFFNHFEVPTAIIGIGMESVHSTEERISLSDMLRTAELIGAVLINP